MELTCNDDEEEERAALVEDFCDYETKSVYVEATKTGQRFMGTVIEWLLNTCQDLRRLSISEGGGSTEKFK